MYVHMCIEIQLTKELNAFKLYFKVFQKSTVCA